MSEGRMGWEADRCSVCSTVNTESVCSGEERTELEGKVIYVPSRTTILLKHIKLKKKRVSSFRVYVE